MPSQVRILLSPLDFTEAKFAGVAQLVELQPSKLNVAGSSPVSRSIELSVIEVIRYRNITNNNTEAVVAQW
jgi:hypothetical protein